MIKISSRDYCRNFVREKDYNLYLLHFFMPRRSRDNALAMMALHCELASIPHKTADPSMMIIRLKWWYDGVNALYEGKSGQDSPVLDALAPAIHNKMICREALEHYMTETEKCIRGEAHKNEAMLYSILANMINEKGRKNRFQNVIQSHQAKGDYTALRPLRLWLSYIKRPEQHHS